MSYIDRDETCCRSEFHGPGVGPGFNNPIDQLSHLNCIEISKIGKMSCKRLSRSRFDHEGLFMSKIITIMNNSSCI